MLNSENEPTVSGELLTQSNVIPCCLAALTGLIAHYGSQQPHTLCENAIALGQLMAKKIETLEDSNAAPCEGG